MTNQHSDELPHEQPDEQPSEHEAPDRKPEHQLEHLSMEQIAEDAVAFFAAEDESEPIDEADVQAPG